jgi:predicted PurR-regulated permease PerM
MQTSPSGAAPGRAPGSALVPPSSSHRFRRVFASILVVFFLLVFLRLVAPFLEAVVLAMVFSGLLYPLYKRLRRGLRNEALASLATTLLALIVVVLPLTLLVGVLAREAVRVTEIVAPWIDDRNVGELSLVLPEWIPYRSRVLENVGDVVNQVGTFVVDSLSRATQSTVIFLLNLFITLYAMFYFFIRGPSLLRLLHDYTPLDNDDKLVIAGKGVAITRATLKSVLIVGSMQGALGGIGFAVAGIESAVFWGIVMAVASAIPALGTALVWVPAVLALYLNGQPEAAIGLAIWCAAVVSTLDNIVRPRLIGKDTKMPDLLILLSTLGGIAMFGVSGIILGPVLAGLFLTSLNIFAATFERELKEGAASPLPVAADRAVNSE